MSFSFQAHADTATLLMKNVYTPLLEISSYKKSQSKKLYSFREAFEGILSKAEEGVFKVKARSYLFSATANYIVTQWSVAGILQQFKAFLPFTRFDKDCDKATNPFRDESIDTVTPCEHSM